MDPEIVVAAAVSPETAALATEATETAAGAAVEIAAIQADRDVEIATITAADDEDMLWLRNQLADLRARSEMLGDSLSALEGRLDANTAQIGEVAAAMTTLAATQSSMTPPLPLETVETAPETVSPEASLAAVVAGPSAANAVVPRTVRLRRNWL